MALKSRRGARHYALNSLDLSHRVHFLLNVPRYRQSAALDRLQSRGAESGDHFIDLRLRGRLSIS
jgi:hypothetical protein